MAELVEVADIPTTSKSIYPWAEWLSELQNGKALRLSRADVPEGSGAHKKWNTTRRGALMRNMASRKGLILACRGEYIYLWRA